MSTRSVRRRGREKEPAPERSPRTRRERDARKQPRGADHPSSPESGGQRRARPYSPPRRTKRPGSRRKRRQRGRRCWSCRQRDHVLGKCPQKGERKFCYRCGRQDCTVSECPRCGPAWLAQGPYVPGLGHVPREIRLIREAAGMPKTPYGGDRDGAGIYREGSGSSY